MTAEERPFRIPTQPASPSKEDIAGVLQAEGATVIEHGRPRPIPKVETSRFPGFPEPVLVDMQELAVRSTKYLEFSLVMSTHINHDELSKWRLGIGRKHGPQVAELLLNNRFRLNQTTPIFSMCGQLRSRLRAAGLADTDVGNAVQNIIDSFHPAGEFSGYFRQLSPERKTETILDLSARLEEYIALVSGAGDEPIFAALVIQNRVLLRPPKRPLPRKVNPKAKEEGL